MKRKAIVSAALAFVLCAGMSVNTYAGENMNDVLEAWLNSNPTVTVTGEVVADDTVDATAPQTQFDPEAYADKVFEMVNTERENAGLPPLERSDYLEDPAQTRVEECASMNSLRYNGQAHTRPDGSRWFTVFGITKNYNYGENVGQGKDTADMQMRSWMASDGHRANILRDDYTEIGIGVAVSEQGKVFAVQIFSRP